jgi:hypothetical protein
MMQRKNKQLKECKHTQKWNEQLTMIAWYMLLDYSAARDKIVDGSQKCNTMCNLQLLDVQVPKAALSYLSTKPWDHKTNKQVNHCANYAK